MFDFLQTVATPPIGVWDSLARVVGALVLGWLVAFVYRRTRPATKGGASMQATLVLLSVLISIVVQVVGESPSKAFSLVGALSIIRFRTVVQDTQDTAFVIFAVVMGMAAGAGAPWIATIGLGVVSLTAVIMRPKTGPGGAAPLGYTLNMRVGLGHDVRELVSGPFAAHLSQHRLISIETVQKGMAVDACYEVDFRDGGSAEALVKALNRLDGVQNVKIEESGFDDD
jgi:hypothetical protein